MTHNYPLYPRAEGGHVLVLLAVLLRQNREGDPFYNGGGEVIQLLCMISVSATDKI